jgi:alkanesulfonate monooxygenase SsuD/methylene tetrahydromethanopterin reductase-like flavin-dependent oxidoreductase (luciferase family)
MQHISGCDLQERMSMKFSVLQFFSWPGRRVPLETVYERAMQRMVIMDQTGYNAVWLAEHHFTDYSVCPSVHMMGLHVASKTKHLRIGTGISLAAFYHPLRLAEEVALLDMLTGGRVNWGAGRGFDPTEFKAFGVPPEESYPRFREAVDIVHAAWNHERLNWHGDYWQFEDVEVLPKPKQQPHPPSWVGVSSEGSIRWAGQQGYGLMLGPHHHYSEIARKREIYRVELESHGHSMAGREIPMTRFLAVADTDAEAEDIARRGASWVVGAYFNASKTGGKAANVFNARRDDDGEKPIDPVQHYLNGVALHGSPERVIDQIQMLRQEMYLDSLMCAPLSHSSFMKFTEKVLPRLL